MTYSNTFLLVKGMYFSSKNARLLNLFVDSCIGPRYLVPIYFDTIPYLAIYLGKINEAD